MKIFRWRGRGGNEFLNVVGLLGTFRDRTVHGCLDNGGLGGVQDADAPRSLIPSVRRAKSGKRSVGSAFRKVDVKCRRVEQRPLEVAGSRATYQKGMAGNRC